MYKGTDFELRPLEEILADVERMGEAFPYAVTVFVGDSDSLQHPDLIEVIKGIRERYPELKRMTSYARSLTLVKKDLQDLKTLRKAGLSRLHVGLESGDPGVLKRIKKGATPETMIKGGKKAREAGFELCYYILCGAGGDHGWKDHASGSAAVINAVNPNFIRLRTLSLVKNAPLYSEWQAGRFQPISPLNRLRETRRLIEKLTVKNCELASDHVTNYLWSPSGIVYQGVDGMLPRDQKAMLETIDRAIDEIQDRDDILDANMMVQKGYIQRL
jgi:biotin synthase-like enzyme